MKTLLKIELDENGIGTSEIHIHSNEERDKLAICLLSLMANVEEFRNVAKAVVQCYNEHTAEVREAVEQTMVPPSALYSNNKQNS